MPELKITFTRVSNTHHTLEFVRDDGSSEKCELETRSTLFHDLVHFAVETEAQLSHAFYGHVATGTPYDKMTELAATKTWYDELALAESVVGPMQSWLRSKDRAETHVFVQRLREYLNSRSDECPPWLTVAFADKVAECVRNNSGHWQSIAFGESLSLTFVVPPKRQD